MKSKSIKLNYVLNTAYQILVLIVPLITTPYISRVLGANGIGIYSYTYSIISYFILCAVMGTSTYAQRTIAFYQDDLENRSKKFFDIIAFRMISTIICCAIYVIYLKSSICVYKEVATIQLIYLIAVAFDVSWLFQGVEDFKRIVLRNTLAKIFNIFLLFIFVKNTEDVIIYTFILSGMTFVANISVWPYLPKYIKKVSLRKITPFSDIKSIISLFIPTIAIQVYAVLDKTMIGYFAVDAVENGYYEQTEKIVRMALAVVTSLGTVMIPRIAKLYHDDDQKKIKYYLTQSYQFVWFLGIPIMCGLIGVAKLFVPVFYGPGYDKIQILLPIYSCLVVAVALSNVTGCQYLIPTKRQNVYTMAVVASAVLNLLLNLILIPKYLSIGAAVASVFAEFLGAIIMMIYVHKKQLVNISNVFKLSHKNWIAGILMLVVVRAMSGVLNATVINLLIAIVVGFFVYGFTLIMQKDDFLFSNCKMIIDKITKKKVM